MIADLFGRRRKPDLMRERGCCSLGTQQVGSDSLTPWLQPGRHLSLFLSSPHSLLGGLHLPCPSSQAHLALFFSSEKLSILFLQKAEDHCSRWGVRIPTVEGSDHEGGGEHELGPPPPPTQSVVSESRQKRRLSHFDSSLHPPLPCAHENAGDHWRS